MTRGKYAKRSKAFTKEKWDRWLARLNTESSQPRVEQRRAAIEEFRRTLK